MTPKLSLPNQASAELVASKPRQRLVFQKVNSGLLMELQKESRALAIAESGPFWHTVHDTVLGI